MKRPIFALLGISLIGLLAVLMPSGLALATGIDGGLEKEVDGYHIQLFFIEHPRTGTNEIEIKIIDPNGGALMGATVEVVPVQSLANYTGNETEGHAQADTGHAEVPSESHPKSGDAAESDHLADSPMDDHDEMENTAGDHQEMENEVHEETTGHSETKAVVLKASEEAGHFSGKVTFTEPGDWSVAVRFVTENEKTEKEVVFPVDVISAGPPWEVLSAFFGMNFIVITVAGFLKRKSLTANA